MMQPERSIFDELDEIDPDADARRLAEAEADITAGRLVPHEKVREWLLSVGTTNESPAPYSWRK